eukprot:SAG11_NODE_35933_length_264_cov_0.866667_1_plen_25_part_01
MGVCHRHEPHADFGFSPEHLRDREL